MKRFVLGITGHRGVGKSTALKVFEKLGAFVISADAIVHKLYSEKKVVYLIAEKFGNEFIHDSKVDRSRLRVFLEENPQKILNLNALIHPFVAERIKGLITASEASFVFIEAVYFEKGFLLDLVDKLILIKRKISLNSSLAHFLKDFYTENANTFDQTIYNDSSLEAFEAKLVEIYKDLS